MADKKDETYIDPQFFLPPGVFDIKYAPGNEVNSEENATEFSDYDSGDSEVTETANDDDTWASVTPESNSVLPIPDTITIVSQTVKAAAGGGYLVDIVIDVPDLPGVENYDVAVTKA
jgi:hypothetical protein